MPFTLEEYLGQYTHPNTRRYRYDDVRKAAEMLGYASQYRNLGAWIEAIDCDRLRSAWEIRQYKPATAMRMISTLRTVLRWAYQSGYLSAESYQRLLSALRCEPRAHSVKVKVNDAIIEALIAACDRRREPQNVRDAAMIAVGYETGLKRIEMRALRVHQLVRDTYAPQRWKLQVMRDRPMELLLSVRASDLLDRWLARRGMSDGYLFCAIAHDCRVKPDQPINPQSFADALHLACIHACVPSLKWQDLRYARIYHMIQDPSLDYHYITKWLGISLSKFKTQYRDLIDRQ